MSIDGGPSRFAFWGEVPPGYMTQTQLRELDLPRDPGGPVRATVEGRDASGHRATFDLYLVSESRPTAADAAELAQSAARRTTGARVCEQCGACPELPCTRVDAWLLCAACAHVDKLRARQKQAADARANAVEQAGRLLADERLAVVHFDYDDGDRVRLTALDAAGNPLFDILMSLDPAAAGPGDPPRGAVGPREAADRIRRALQGRVMLVWHADDLADFSHALHGLDIEWPFPAGYGNRHDLFHLALDWRCDLDPHSGQPRPLVPPGRADRMLYLLGQIAVPAEQYLGRPPRGHR
ncbi:hypothetical protein [Streptomyces sp. NPDC101393]|uniref:hypothetical protein n=1 Tax=Streptomyces sp. NPDC101393 TaxID=3366141 RepID=UPI0037F6EA06